MKLKTILLISCWIVFISSSFAQNATSVFPQEEWAYDKCNTVNGIRPFIVDSMNTTGLVITHGGKIVFSYGNIEEVSYIASCRKSMLSLLYGTYVNRAALNLESTLAELEIDDVQGLLPMEKKATLADILASKSGVYHPSSYPGDDIAFAPQRGSQVPGSYFLYNNWDFNVAGAIFEKVTGTNIYDALEHDLGKPLQFQDFDRSLHKKTGNLKSSKYPAYPMYLSARDLARVGQLMLQGGKWETQQLVPVDWVEYLTTIVTPNESMYPARLKESKFGYGRLWWIYDQPNLRAELKGAYTAQGIYGQFLTVIPELDMVIAHKTNSTYERHTLNYDKLVNLIIDNSTHLLADKTTADEIDLKNYIGKYDNDQISIDITIEDGGLSALSPIGKLKFIICDQTNFSIEKEDRFGFQFVLDDESKVKNFSLNPDILGMGEFKKIN